MAEKDKKKRAGRKVYLNDFKVGAGGQYVYTGAVYRFTSSKRTSFVSKLSLLTALLLLSAVAEGCISAAGMDDCFYVILPFIAEIAFAVAVTWAVVRILYSGENIRKYVYDATFGRLPAFCIASAASAAVGIICTVTYIILNGFEGKLTATIIFIVLKVIAIVSALLTKKLLSAAPIEK